MKIITPPCTNESTKKGIKYFLLSFLLIKIVFLALFTSGYQLYLFYPFTDWFVKNLSNPWEAIEIGLISAEFPYSSVMLYILSAFNYVIVFFDISNSIIANFIYSIPLLIADITIALSMLKLAQSNRLYVLLVYFTSPIILFSTYIHHQLDSIPIAFLLVSFCFLDSRKYAWSAIILGLAMSAKLNIFLALPLVFIYLSKQNKFKSAFLYITTSILVFILSSYPFIFSDAYISNVILNTKQKLLFDSSIVIGGTELYLPIFLSSVLYAYFFSFNKVNKDLLISFTSLLFITNIFFINPSPGWYVWILPFIILAISKNAKKQYDGHIILFVLNIAYLLYFSFSHEYDNIPVIFIDEAYDLFLSSNTVSNNILFTILGSCIVCTGLYVFKTSVKSNNLYRRKTPFIIGVGGDSGTGKTTLKTLTEKLFKNNLLTIEGDGDHRWERGNKNWANHTHLNPKANWLHRQSENLIELKNWRSAHRVDYDHSTGTFTEQYLIRPKSYILISGLHPFYLPLSRKSLDLKIYMEPNENLRRYWKIERDIKNRGYSIEKIIGQIEERMVDARKYIYPQKDFADLVISFFSLKDINVFSSDCSIDLGLKIKCGASIELESILSDIKVSNRWDYEEDLNSQIVELYSSPSDVDFSIIANKYIPNIDELIYEPEFESGYNGFIQLIVLLSISQKMKGE